MMLILRLWYFLVGCVQVDIMGSHSERLINLAAVRGVYLWNIRRIDKYVLRALVGINGFAALRPVARITGCGLHINKKLGLPFVTNRLMRRKAFIIGGIACACSIVLIAGRVWFFEIDGGKAPKFSEERAIRRILKENGVVSGISRASVDERSLEAEILARRKRIAFVSVDLWGTCLQVEYVAKVLPDVRHLGPCDIVASKSGVISKAITFTGQARIAEGDAVTAGQVLIEGVRVETVHTGDERTDDLVETARVIEVKADGLVEAITTYEGYGEQSLERVNTNRTGRRKSAYAIKLGSFFMTVPRQPPGFNEYDAKTERVFRVGWRKWCLPVEVWKMRFEETHTVVEYLTPDEAIRKARKRALAAARAIIPGGCAQLALREAISLPDSSSPGMARVRVFVDCNERIGVSRLR